MPRTIVIGGEGHIGTYLVPRLVEAGHQVVSISRGMRRPYQPHPTWALVETLRIDRTEGEAAGRFAARLADLEPDLVIDLICFELKSARSLVEALRGKVQHFVHIGTIWVHGVSMAVPTLETAPRKPFGDYGIKKAAIEAFLLEEARRGNLPATILHPGHIVGPGWAPLNPAGHFNPGVFTTLARGERLALPNFGLETFHHVHADDVALMVMRAIEAWSASVGEAFHTVSSQAINLRSYAEAMAAYFGTKADLEFLPWPEWEARQRPEEAKATWEHIVRSPNCSIEKARTRLGFAPRYSSIEAVIEAVDWLVEAGQVQKG